MENFTNKQINFDILKERAHNLRWAEVPDGVIPLTAADHDFPCAPEVVEALTDSVSVRTSRWKLNMCCPLTVLPVVCR